MSAQGADFERGDRQLQIIHRARRRREMENEVQRLRHFDVTADVMIDEAKARIFQKLADIFLGAGRVIIHAQHLVPLAEETLAQMRTDKTRAASHQISSHGSFLSIRR